MDDWKPGAQDNATKMHPYDDMLKRVQAAQKSGVLKGILWHQGESNRNDPLYGKKLTDLIEMLRKDLNAPGLPFVAGEISDFKPVDQNGRTGAERAKEFNDRVQALTKTVKNYSCVSSEDLNHKGDNLHYDTVSARILGKRYAEKMLALQKLN